MVRRLAEAVCQQRIDICCVRIRENRRPGSRFDAAMKTTAMMPRIMREELSYATQEQVSQSTKARTSWHYYK